MKKILVTTDFSESPKAALRFVKQWASQEAAALTVLPIIELLRPTSWRNTTYAAYEKRELNDNPDLSYTVVNDLESALTDSKHPC